MEIEDKGLQPGEYTFTMTLPFTWGPPDNIAPIASLEITLRLLDIDMPMGMPIMGMVGPWTCELWAHGRARVGRPAYGAVPILRVYPCC
jgi:hypothetical protein